MILTINSFSKWDSRSLKFIDVDRRKERPPRTVYDTCAMRGIWMEGVARVTGKLKFKVWKGFKI